MQRGCKSDARKKQAKGMKDARGGCMQGMHTTTLRVVWAIMQSGYLQATRRYARGSQSKEEKKNHVQYMYEELARRIVTRMLCNAHFS
jgi:hypothetical protein